MTLKDALNILDQYLRDLGIRTWSTIGHPPDVAPVYSIPVRHGDTTGIYQINPKGKTLVKRIS